jgi:uncharacterized protein (TIGR02996 family)
VTTEDDFQRQLDEQPTDWQTRLVFADWLADRGDPRAAGYRAIAIQERRPLQGHNKDREAWWWHALPSGASNDNFYNIIPYDWFELLPPGEGSKMFWPVFSEKGGVKSRRECEDALALAFSRLPPERQAALLAARITQNA